jgi:hypothetical protein
MFVDACIAKDGEFGCLFSSCSFCLS